MGSKGLLTKHYSALARAGKKVLHLDSNENYGGSWGVMSFKDLLQWSQKGTFISIELLSTMGTVLIMI